MTHAPKVKRIKRYTDVLLKASNLISVIRRDDQWKCCIRNMDAFTIAILELEEAIDNAI